MNNQEKGREWERVGVRERWAGACGCLRDEKQRGSVSERDRSLALVCVWV